MRGRKEIILTLVVFAALNLPALTSLNNPSTTPWLLTDLGLTNLTLLHLFLLLSLDFKAVIVLTGPILVAISFGLSTAISEFMVQKGSWLSTYYLIFTAATACLYSIFTKLLFIHQLSEFSRFLNPCLKTFTLVPLMLCSFGGPTYTLLRSVFDYPDINIWIWGVAIALGFFLLQFTIFSSIYINIKFYGIINPKTHIWFNITCLVHLFIFSPAAVYFIFSLVRSLSLTTTHISTIFLLFNVSLLGLTIIPGAAFTIFHGFLYLKFHFLRRCRGQALPWFYNRSIFAYYSGQSGAQPLIGNQENEDDEENSSPLVMIKFRESEVQTECCICLEEFKKEDKLITAEGCNHIYHLSCMAKWRVMKNTCPKCRTKVSRMPLDEMQPEQPAAPA